MSAAYDVIVIGVGSMGSAACYKLAKTGVRVLGLEQFSIPNELSSHTGQSRIIRKAYFEHPDYVPLLQRAYAIWAELETTIETQIYYPTGLLYVGRPDHPVMTGVKKSAATFSIPLEKLKHKEAKRKYPQLQLPDNAEVLLEPEAGFLRPELCIQAFTNAAFHLGACIKSNCTVLDWKNERGTYTVNTTEGTFTADKLIITAGPWIGRIIPQWQSMLRVTKQVLAWIEPQDRKLYALGKFPCWIIADDQYAGVHYGFPALPANRFDGPIGMKLAHHYPGALTDPETIDRTVPEAETAELLHFANRYFDHLDTTSVNTKVCMYTNTVDEHFIVDFLPGHDEQVIIATGFSGHGFKFASVIGEILCELTTTGKSKLPIEFLRAGRFDSIG